MNRRVVITGVGVVSPNGIGAEAFTRACLEGKSGLSRFSLDHPSKLKTSSIGRVNLDMTGLMESAEMRRVPRVVHLALHASKQAIEQAQLHIDENDIDTQRKIGVSFGTGGGGLGFVEEQYREYFEGGTASLYSITGGTHGNLSSELSIALRLRGASHVVSTGCTSSTDAIGHAMMMIRSGMLPMVLVGGADAPIMPGILSGFEKMRVISTRHWGEPAQASRPFSADRDGFVLGEGAWMFVLEDADHAAARGATVIAELLGYASTCDAYHRVQIAPDVVEPVRAMELAMQDASVAKDEIGYINLHGTGTDLNDRLETLAIRRCFNAHSDRLIGSSTKSMVGHPQGACGAAGLAATILCLREGYAHPTINLTKPDPQCDLNYVPNDAQKCDAKIALCNCIAFGSKNSAIVVKV